MRKLIASVLAIAIIGIAAYLGLRSRTAAGNSTSASLIPLLSEGDTAGFKKAIAPDSLEFPRDLGPHNDYQTEWWYYTGNLSSDTGRLFGFQLTFFRRAIAPPGDMGDTCLDNQAGDPVGQADTACPDESAWRTNQLYLAHFTISDIENDAFHPFERFSRGAAGLAGAQSVPYRVWLEDWQAGEVDDGQVRLQARSGNISLDLLLTETLPPILHGEGGLSVKGPEIGNASYYYSLVQQEAQGVVGVEDGQFAVTGLAWKDHEYSTSALSAGAVGWDWFSIQLDNGAALMFFQIRNEDGQIETASSGTFVYPDGSSRSLDSEAWQLEVLDTWTSPTTGITYPAGWQIEIPDLNLILTGQPLMADQELNVSTVYWEGATGFTGQLASQPITGAGYVELTGYGEEMSGRQ
jgi:predicted secreted hydrolase